ncbi:HNH endonuclease [Synechococcus sp. PCC 7336]|uniref:HNH endonuclease n=1 Tax=Synechococcus sp. PCC 7336 TaxID=195250 RepID=UPI00138ACB0E|nr:HNH endonuclease [Synechococcus sp. PCC 7336]
MGSYCSYCERKLSTGLAVEHIQPKILYPDLETEWTNFLLGCANCNSTKGDKDVDILNFLWPHLDNTLLAFVYSKGGFVQLHENLTAAQAIRAQAILDLVGLQRHQAPGWKTPSPRDKRWLDREQVWAAAERSRDLFEALNRSEAAKKLVLEVAQSSSFFSVWITVFEAYSDIKKELIQFFPGTSSSCFDPDGMPLNRPGRII